MSDARQVKVDNWGIYFLQRLKHFFNRTDYCDLTLQFQDNAQLKVHRLVLSACTEYFELLERTCEMYEDCLVMPDDLQADVVVPIINFMYTGQLEFKIELLEKLYQTSLVMNLPILTKLLEAHRPIKKPPPAKPAFSSSANYYGKRYTKTTKSAPIASSSGNKRSYSSAFDNTESRIDLHKIKKPSPNPVPEIFSKAECIVKNGNSSSFHFPVFSQKNKRLSKEPRPTRYELPEELDEENLFDNSFTNISYGSKPLMVHPETATKQYAPKRINLFEEGSSSSRFMSGPSNDIVECRKISSNESIFLDPLGDNTQDDISFQSSSHMETKDNSLLFDQILENKPSKITIETKNSAQAQNLDHAKIISEVLKKYPHLVKSNKNIKLKILNTTKTNKKANPTTEEKPKPKRETPDFTYESDVINSKEAAKLIAMGAENIAGPWICLICGTPGKALHFTSYYNFRKHLVEVHNEKPVPSICEFCGVKSQKRNYIVHHKLTKHGVPAPPAYNFPKCNNCSYIALNEALLVKHKTSHSMIDKAFKYNLPRTQMARIAQKIGKKYPTPTVDQTNKLQCVYCMRIFLRENNLYAHLKINHKEAARNDGLIDDSDEEQEEEKFSNIKINNIEPSDNMIKLEVPVSFENSYEDVNEQYQIEQKPDGSICVSAKKPRVLLPSPKNKILNLGFSSPQQDISSEVHPEKTDPVQNTSFKRNEFSQNKYSHARPTASIQDSVIIDNNEYILHDNQLIPKKEKMGAEYVLSHAPNDAESILPTTSVEYHNTHSSSPERKMLVKKSTHINQPYQIVVSSEEEYKALINTSKSVLYDDGETNKTLSDLGEPDNSSLGTGPIDLDNTQSNDMMIIPDYHMNVPETVSADNSNIVVVYSHPVDEPNKQYSLITTQGHFVQSSAILTQNYETVTTCTPVLNTHNAGETWQDNIHPGMNKLPIHPSVELQTMTVGESITISPMENLQSNSLNEMAQVQLTTAEPVTIELAQTETCTNTLDESNIITTISQPSGNALICQQNTMITLADATVLSNFNQGQVQALPNSNNDQITSITSFETNSINTTEEQITTVDEIPLNSHELEPAGVEEILHQNEDDNPTTEIVTDNVAESNLISDSIIKESNSLVGDTPVLSDSTVDETNLIANDSIVATVNEEGGKFQDSGLEAHIEEEETVENIAKDINESRVEQEQCIITEQTTDEEPFTEIAKEHIENLTSEWSDEESEITIAVQSNVSIANKDEQNHEITISAEAEESIENIQKEVNKQATHRITAAEDNIPSPCDSSGNSQTDTKDSENVAANSHEKISSLLNDWDDNDSQEEDIPAINDNDKNVSANTETENISTVDNSGTNDSIFTDNNNATVDNGGATIEKGKINKNDNIKSLVSDWDEDDEEENGDLPENVE